MEHIENSDVRRLLEVAKSDHSLYTMILLAWRHGLRESEVTKLRVQDFDLFRDREQAFITVQRLKGSLKTTQPLFADEVEALLPLLEGKAKTDYLFPGRTPGKPVVRQTFFLKFQKLCQSLGIPKHLSHPHALKHTCGMTVIKSGIENARQYLGHKSISSTGAYLRVSDDAASKAAAAAFGA